ncbi:MAG: hypothetical protein ACOCX9_05795 [Spirochaetota bacterium]
MKITISTILLMTSFVFLCCTSSPAERNIQTVEGTAQLSKAGLVVGSVMIMNLSADEMESYNGKYVRARGVISYDHPWMIDTEITGKNNDSDDTVIRKQGFTMPAMVEVIEISVVEK